MAAYAEEFQLSHDIDWFASVNGCMIHAASNCSVIPRGADDRETIQTIRNYIASHLNNDERQEVDINEGYVRYRFQQSIEFGVENTDAGFALFRTNYIASFLEMAELGFFSFDRHVNLIADDLFDIEKIYSPSYVLVAKPRSGRKNKIEYLPKLNIVKVGTYLNGSQQIYHNLNPYFDFTYKFL